MSAKALAGSVGHLGRLIQLAVLIKCGEDAFDVAPVEGFGESLHRLDVLLRHHLLRQPGGFQSLGALVEVDLADALAVTEGMDLELPVFDLDAAAPAAAPVGDGHYDGVPGVDELLGNRLKVLPIGVPTLPDVPDCGRTARWRLLTDVPDDVGSEIRGSADVVAPAVGLQAPTHVFDVLLRHRPRSIAARGSDYEFQVPIFVVTHHPPAVAPKQDENLTFTFVIEGAEDAVEQAKAAAGDGVAQVVGGPNLIQQLLVAGLGDELRVDVKPVILAGGLRLFEDVDPDRLRLGKLPIQEVGARTSLAVRVEDD
jgi:dihydrofolate reductase